MYWNDRVFRNYDPEHDYTHYTVHEVYYNENDEIMGYIDYDRENISGKAPWGDSVDELKWVLTSMLESLDKPVIDRIELEAYFDALRDEDTSPPEEEYEVFDSVEELLAALERDDDDSQSGEVGT